MIVDYTITGYQCGRQGMKKKPILITVISGGILLSACAQEEPGSTRSAPANAVIGIPALMESANVPGLAIATIDDCAIRNVDYYGVLDVETGAPIDENAIFEAASLTKTVFSLIVNQLTDEGLIGLDAPLAETFDYPRIIDKQAFAVLTPRIILEHRSGLPNWSSDPLDRETWGDIPFKNPPDTTFGYSGEAYQLLQSYIESKTGKSLDQLFEERLSGVMSASSLSMPKPGASLAFGHDDDGGHKHGRALKPSQRAGAAYSGLTNARDYAQFLTFLCDGGGMSEATRSEMLRPQSPTDDAAISWALGWGIQLSGDGPLYFHWGDNEEFKAFTAFNPKTGDGVVYFANAMNGLKLIEPLAGPVVGDVAPIASWLGYGSVESAKAD